MFNLILVLQRSILLPLTLLTIITDWTSVVKRASDAGVQISNREIDGWTKQIEEDNKAFDKTKKEAEALRKQHAAAKAKQRNKNKKDAVDASSF